MKVACIVQAHRDPEQVALLCRALRHPQVQIYLHLDRRADAQPFVDALSRADSGAITWLTRRNTPWGSPSLLDSILDGVRAAWADNCEYFILLSGQDFPLRSADEIVAFAKGAGTRSFIEHWPASASVHRFAGRDRTDFYTYRTFGRPQTCIPRGEDTAFLNWRGKILNAGLQLRGAFKPQRHFPAYAHPFVGATWWNLSRPAVDYALEFLQAHPDYRTYHQYTLVAEELFYQSILAGTDYPHRYELVPDAKRFYIWEGTHARALTLADLPALLASDKLFARKIDSAQPELRAHLTARLGL